MEDPLHLVYVLQPEPTEFPAIHCWSAWHSVFCSLPASQRAVALKLGIDERCEQEKVSWEKLLICIRSFICPCSGSCLEGLPQQPAGHHIYSTVLQRTATKLFFKDRTASLSYRIYCNGLTFWRHVTEHGMLRKNEGSQGIIMALLALRQVHPEVHWQQLRRHSGLQAPRALCCSYCCHWPAVRTACMGGGGVLGPA